jgi:4'-phosphopantetheinyl transferase
MSANSVNRESFDPMVMNRIISLTAAEIHLWLAFYDEINEEPLLSAYRDLLEDAEKKQEPRFYFAKDRRRYLVTRALVRTVLSRYAPIQPREWVFSANAYGRPDIVNVQAKDSCLSFNISHTHSLIVLGVTKGRALGVDVENFRARAAAIEIADHYFAPLEVAALAAVQRQQQQYRFFEYWTFKESYIKARGMGLSLPLDKFSFHYPDEQTVEIAIDPELADDPGRWQFWQLQPRPEYLVAICAERTCLGSPSLIVRETVPMLSEREIPCEFLRLSTFDRAQYARNNHNRRSR